MKIANYWSSGLGSTPTAWIIMCYLRRCFSLWSSPPSCRTDKLGVTGIPFQLSTTLMDHGARTQIERSSNRWQQSPKTKLRLAPFTRFFRIRQTKQQVNKQIMPLDWVATKNKRGADWPTSPLGYVWMRGRETLGTRLTIPHIPLTNDCRSNSSLWRLDFN